MEFSPRRIEGALPVSFHFKEVMVRVTVLWFVFVTLIFSLFSLSLQTCSRSRMAEAADRNYSTSIPPPSLFGSSNRDSSRLSSVAATSSPNTPPSLSSSSHVREDEEGQNHDSDQQNQFREPEIEQQQHLTGNFRTFDDRSNVIRDDTWSCIAGVLTFLLFGSMTLILGVFGSLTLRFGPSSSILIRPSRIFVQSIKVQELGETKPGLILYGFYRSPPLDVVSTWSETINASVPPDSHEEFIYFLNEGSQINISYCVKSDNSSIYLVIAQGNEDLARWLEDPTYPNSTLSWNVIHGSGIIKQNIWRSSNYYVALGNLNSEMVEVQMNLSIQALLYNTSEAYSKCMFRKGVCSLSVLFPQGNAIVINSPGVGKGSTSDVWNVKLSYGPRWFTYILCIGGLTVLALVAFNCLNKYQYTREGGDRYQLTGSERAPLLSHKDDDLSSWGSFYDSASNDEEDLGDFLASGTHEGKSSGDGENGNNTRRLCAICFDAPRDCFFLPCGHCVACFACGTRIAEVAGNCPICRRNMKKVRKIFTV